MICHALIYFDVEYSMHGIDLMSNIPDNAIFWGVKYVVQRDFGKEIETLSLVGDSDINLVMLTCKLNNSQG